jgi:hypothetical protein
MPAIIAEVKVPVITADVLIQAIIAFFFQTFVVQDQTSTYVIYHWVCGSVLRQEL